MFGSSIFNHLVEDSLAILSVTREEILQVLANDQRNLGAHDDDEEERESELHSEDLDISLDKSHTRVPVEGLPRVQHSNDTGPTNDLRDNLSTEAAVEGNDALNLIWEEGGLHTGQNNIGRDDNQESESDGQCKDREALENQDVALSIGVLGVVLWVTDEAISSSEVSWEDDSELLSDSEDGSWASDLLPCLDGWNALVPRLWVRVGDHDVCPGQGESCAKCGCDDGSKEEGNEDGEHL